jgi:V/A-type H+-transporting ATPase subunit C
MQMTRARDLRELSDSLLKSEYSAELSKIPTSELDAYKLERIFYRRLSERLSFLFQITSGKVREILEEYFERIEVENIRRILRALHGKEKVSEEQLVPIPRRYQTVNFSALLETHTVREMVAYLKETPYVELRDSVSLYESYNNPLVLEARLDKIYNDNFWNMLEKMRDREVKRLVGTEIDLKNLFYMLSLKFMKTEEKIIREVMIDVHYKLHRNLIEQLMGVPYETIPRILTWPPYVDLAKKSLELLHKGLAVESENVFSRYLYSYAETVALRNPNGLAYAFAYLYLCLREAKNLTALAVGKQLKLDNEKIQNLLLL